MTLSLVFNELSLQEDNLAPDIRTARQWMSELVATLETAIDHNLNQVRTDRHFTEMLLAEEYPFRKWMNDPAVAKRDQEFLLFYFSQYPLVVPPTADLSENDEIRTRSELFEVHHNGRRGSGLGYAVLFDSISLSLLSEPCWDAFIVDLVCTEYSPEVEDLVETSLKVRHASRSQHLSQNHAVWIESRLRSIVQDGNDLWTQTAEWFPNLLFCEDAQRQIQDLNQGTPQLTGIVERLVALEEYCKRWESGGFDRRDLPPQYECSPESPQTLNQAKFRAKREFVCPDGERRLFDLHLKGLRGHWRIHFWPDVQNRKIIVGYVGPHLPTVSDPT